jgi:hypothetical protein
MKWRQKTPCCPPPKSCPTYAGLGGVPDYHFWENLGDVNPRAWTDIDSSPDEPGTCGVDVTFAWVFYYCNVGIVKALVSKWIPGENQKDGPPSGLAPSTWNKPNFWPTGTTPVRPAAKGTRQLIQEWNCCVEPNERGWHSYPQAVVPWDSFAPMF